MRSRLLSLLALPAVAVLAASTSPSYAAVQSRIASISSSSSVALPHTIPARALAASDQGPASANRMLDSLTLRFNMTDAQQAALNQLLVDQQNPSSPRYRQWLTPEQFGEQFGLSSQDLTKVSAWLTSQGLTVTGTSRSNTFITFSGSVAQVQNAFGTSIHSLLSDGEQHIANVSDPVLPSAIAGVVSTITGLNDFRLKSRARVRQVPATAQPDALHPQFTSSISGSHFMAPGDFYTIYDIPNPLTSGNLNGSGKSIAVVGQVDISLADVAAFRAAAGLPANPPTVKLFGPDPGVATSSTSTPSTGDLDEAQLDVEWSGAAAPSASIIYVNSKDVLNTSLVQAIDAKVAPIVSISYGLCEAGAGAANIASFNQLFQQANSQGITVVAPAGDSGATDCDYSTSVATGGLAVDFPASSPNVTGVGGTMFNEGTTTGATTYWSATNSTTGGSALSYIPEAVWNESGTSGLGAGGGGSSIFFTKPTWQTGNGVPADNARDVPDVSLDAASGHDGYLFCSQGSCTNGFRNASNNLNVVGGTSVATPSFAGILALVQQQIGSAIGNANPTIYGLANSTSYNNIFHDITTGNNDSPCIAGTPNCPTGGSIGYNAAQGYDLATGWGSIDAANLATKWTTVATSGIATPITTSSSYTTLTTSTSLCALSSGTITLNVTVANGGTQGNVAQPTPLTTAPTGTVQFLVDNTPVTSAVVTLSNGSASYKLDVSKFSGAHTISAVYSGDTNYIGSRGTLLDSTGAPAPLDIVSATTADFSLTPCGASATVASGATSSGVVLTITPVHGFTGSVTMSADTADSISATYSFSVTPVVINSASKGTTSFVLNAFQTKAQGTTGRLKLASGNQPLKGMPWYVSGSGATLACLLLITVPRRRRWGALLAVVLSVAALGAVGCGSGNTNLTGTGGGTGTGTGTTTNAAPGTYTITITATSGTIVHSSNVTFTIQ
jgi:subtilase family serine protease